jgi:hypothetical protein
MGVEITRAALNGAALAALERGDGLQAILAELFRLTGIPVVLWNLNGRLIFSPRPVDSTSIPAWAADRRVAEMYRSGEPTEIVPEGGASRFACAPLLCGGGTEGLAAAEFSEETQRETAQLLAQKAAALYGYFHAPSGAPAGRADETQVSFARELLAYDGSSGLVFEFVEWQASSGGAFGPGYVFAVAQADGDDASALVRAETALAAENARHYSLVTAKELRVVFFGQNGGLGVREQRLLTRLAAEYGLRWGVSSVVQDLKQRRFFKRQAWDALQAGRAGRSDETVFTASDGYADLLIYEACQNIGGRLLALSDIEKLAVCDAENHTEYIRTLEVYLRCRNRLTGAAKALFIDRGTLKYRLGKIRDLLGVDFEQYRTAALLRLGLRVYRMTRGGGF